MIVTRAVRVFEIRWPTCHFIWQCWWNLICSVGLAYHDLCLFLLLDLSVHDSRQIENVLALPSEFSGQEETDSHQLVSVLFSLCFSSQFVIILRLYVIAHNCRFGWAQPSQVRVVAASLLSFKHSVSHAERCVSHPERCLFQNWSMLCKVCPTHGMRLAFSVQAILAYRLVICSGLHCCVQNKVYVQSYVDWSQFSLICQRKTKVGAQSDSHSWESWWTILSLYWKLLQIVKCTILVSQQERSKGFSESTRACSLRISCLNSLVSQNEDLQEAEEQCHSQERRQTTQTARVGSLAKAALA